MSNFEKYTDQFTMLFGQNKVDVAYLFGSQAKNRTSKLSDVDIAVLLADEVPRECYLQTQIELTAQLMKLLRINQVDVVILNRATPVMKHQVIKCRTVLYEKSKEIRVNFEVRAVNEYLDTAYLRRVQREYMLKQLDEGTYFDRPIRYRKKVTEIT